MSAISRRLWLAALLLVAGCVSSDPARTPPPSKTLRIGLGPWAYVSTTDEAGLTQLLANLTSETLLLSYGDGRPIPVLAEKWVTAPDGLSFRLTLRPSTFHDGTPVTSEIVRETLARRLPRVLGPAFDDIREIRAAPDRDIVFELRRPSRFPLEALDVTVTKPGDPLSGTGPFKILSEGGDQALVASEGYPGGRPGLDRIEFKPYDSIRAAWADLLRGNVDMLYEVAPDALDSLEPSSRVKVFTYTRHYQYLVLFNTKRQPLNDPALRRALNAAVDRSLLVAEALRGQATPSTGPVWPTNWASPKDGPAFVYSPSPIADPGHPLVFTCLVADPAYERLAIALQRQLRSVGVQLNLKMDGPAESLRRVSDGDFDLVLVEAISAPNLLRPYLFWHSKGPYNYGGFSSPSVDAALDATRHAVDDEAYAAGVAAFQRAIVADPPALFLAWGQRARAVSTAFDVQVEPLRDPLATLRFWRPSTSSSASATN
ncbi:MAG: ABC transporter substrate-binding protein [Vicinamibacterales bacterium]